MLLDTSIVVDVLRRGQQAIAFVASFNRGPSLSTISVTEIYAGLRRESERHDIERFISVSIIISLDFEIARLAGDYVRRFKASHGVGPIDAVIAATSTHHGLKLATLDLKHFPMFPGLERPY